jgi:hypothetical protein
VSYGAKDTQNPREALKAKILSPTNTCVIKEPRLRQESSLLPGPLSPDYSLFPASLNHGKLIGSMNPCYAGGLVRRHTLPDPETVGGDLWVSFM